MLTCSNCGATIREGAKFCTACGTRLNDSASAPSSNIWAVPEPAPEPNVIVNAAQEPDVVATSSASPADAAGSGGFSWSWGSPMAAESSDSTTSPGGDDESGVVISERDASEDTTGDTIADATELEILDDQPSVSDETLVDGVATADAENATDPDASAVIDDATASTGDDEPGAETLPDDEGDDTDTLAAWAGEWESSEVAESQDDAVDVLDTSVKDETAPEVEAEDTTADDATVTEAGSDSGDIIVEEEATVSEAEIEPVPAIAEAVALGTVSDPAGAAKEVEDDGEDTVAKAERLIGELQAIIPALARPRPAVPAMDSDAAQSVANDLDSAARIGQFDDVRETLLAARDNPRDVDNMLRLSSNVDRLLELLDDRNNLAKTATSAAGRLRKVGEATEV
jgi:hypothetical protein